MKYWRYYFMIVNKKIKGHQQRLSSFLHSVMRPLVEGTLSLLYSETSVGGNIMIKQYRNRFSDFSVSTVCVNIFYYFQSDLVCLCMCGQRVKERRDVEVSIMMILNILNNSLFFSL